LGTILNHEGKPLPPGTRYRTYEDGYLTERIVPEKDDPLDRQVGGDHYKKFPIQPVEYIRKNGLGWFEGNVVKYVTRHRFKNKRQDIEKAIHMLECILKEYDDGDLK
jgi:hypothetical protein